MKILVLGTRGIPSILGGVETHCEELYPLIAAKEGIEVEVICRTPYVENVNESYFKNIKLTKIFAPKIKSLEAIIHSLLGVCYAGIKRPDILHIHAIGPSLVTPLARLFGLKVVITHHGPDYERQKWGKFAKGFLRLGEFFGIKYSNAVIVISEEIKEKVIKKFGRDDLFIIYNGVSISDRPKLNEAILNKYGLEAGNYIFTLGRFVEEKGFHDLIEVYKKVFQSVNIPLVIAGDADHETVYSKKLKILAKTSNVILPGFVKGEDLTQLFSNCRLFVLPSYYEGLPIALLEAMAYRLPILASDIRANLQVKMPKESYYKTGNISELESKILTELTSVDITQERVYNMENYNWNKIAEATLKVYNQLLK